MGRVSRHDVLMVVFGWVEFSIGFDLGHDGGGE
jgi:hypothetical protein